MRKILSGLILVAIIVGAYILANGGLTEASNATQAPDGQIQPGPAPDPASNKNFNL